GCWVELPTSHRSPGSHPRRFKENEKSGNPPAGSLPSGEQVFFPSKTCSPDVAGIAAESGEVDADLVAEVLEDAGSRLAADFGQKTLAERMPRAAEGHRPADHHAFRVDSV